MNKVILIIALVALPALIFAQRKSIPLAKMQAGKAIYLQRCATCHQIDGAGSQNMIPPLIKTEFVLGDKNRLIGIVLNGLNGEMKVNGDTYGNEMPAHNDLKDADIAAVLTYVRNSFGNKASAVSATTVKKVRSVNKK